MELQLRKLAMAFTALLFLQLLWSAGRLWFLSEPAAIVPAESSVRIGNIDFGQGEESGDSEDLVRRPLFWKGRQAHVAQQLADTGEAPPSTSGSSEIDKVKLLGVYGAGSRSGIIVDYKGKHRRVILNESIGDWTLTMMSADGAIFESGDDSRTLDLEHAVSVATNKQSKNSGRTARTKENTNVDSQQSNGARQPDETGE